MLGRVLMICRKHRPIRSSDPRMSKKWHLEPATLKRVTRGVIFSWTTGLLLRNNSRGTTTSRQQRFLGGAGQWSWKLGNMPGHPSERWGGPPEFGSWTSCLNWIMAYKPLGGHQNLEIATLGHSSPAIDSETTDTNSVCNPALVCHRIHRPPHARIRRCLGCLQTGKGDLLALYTFQSSDDNYKSQSS